MTSLATVNVDTYATPGAVLLHMRRRCKTGTCLAAAGYASVFTLDLIRPTALRTSVDVGLEALCLAVAVLFALAAIGAWVMSMPARSIKAETGGAAGDAELAEGLLWALQLGQDMADAEPRTPVGREGESGCGPAA